MRASMLVAMAAAAILAGVVAVTALFTVRQTEQVIVMQFGDPRRVITEPGLHVKVPFVQNVVPYEKRILDLDPPVERVLLSDQKPLNVDAFARYRIDNPLKFFQTVRREENLRERLGSIINANLRSVLGNVTLASVLSDQRAAIMGDIQSRVEAEAERFGLALVDLRIGRADLPEEVSEAVYERMRSERQREAAEFRAQGHEAAALIRARADREATVIRAEARREADIIRGEGEAHRTAILNEAYGQDKRFFEFYRTIKAYEKSFETGNSYMVLSTDSEFFRLLGEGDLTEPLGENVPHRLPSAAAEESRDREG